MQDLSLHLKKNPLSQLLGAALKEIRKEIMSSDDVAAGLGVYNSKYRMIESGNLVLPTELVLPLLQLQPFESISFNKLMKYLACNDFLELGLK